MKKTTMAGVLMAAALAATVRAGEYADEVRQALQGAVKKAEAAMASSAVPKAAPIAVLPVAGDTSGRYLDGLLKNAATAAGLNCVEGKTDPMWEEILKEIEWHERKADILDPATLAKFGKLQAAKLLMYAFVREANVTGQRVFVELEVHISSVETKQHLWGGTFAERFYLPGPKQGQTDLDLSLRKALKDAFEKAATSLAGSGKLKQMKTVLVVPFAGDVDGYVTGLGKDMFRTTSINPKDLDVQTLSQARIILRDQPQQADGVILGSVKDLYRQIKNIKFEGTNYEVRAEAQIEIQGAGSNEILWSETVAAVADDFRPRVTAPADEVKLGVWEYVKSHPVVVLYVLGGIVGLFILFGLVGKMTRPR